jgi:pSer/pThr/pTyr-binding forkhead associated (FHA) protein
MMTGITLTVRGGRFDGKAYKAVGRAECVLGRALDCDVCLARVPVAGTISRHHCVIRLGPSGVRVQDLGSRNGTHLNGMQIGRPANWPVPAAIRDTPCQDYELHDGDVLEIGDVVLDVRVALTAEAFSPWQAGLVTSG